MGKINISRYVNTTELKFEVEFITPAFLGGADGNAEIRTAPFKNLIRRWWRIANGNLNSNELWQKESELFGSTEKNPETENKIFGKSKIELKIVNNFPCQDLYSNDSEKNKLNKFLYLGYGPISNKQAETRRFIKPNSKIPMILTVPKNEKESFINILSLINLFGSIGSRSRKGFGSISIIPNEDFKLSNLNKLKEDISSLFLEPSKMNIKNYPFCIGKDEKGVLCWNTITPKDTYEEVLNELTEIYRNVVKAAKEKSSNGRMILGSAVGIKGIDEIKRIPSSLILKVAKSGKKYTGRIFHLPFNINTEIKDQDKVWSAIYSCLDNLGLKRFGGASK